MGQDELDRRNDEALAHLEDEWLEPDEDKGYHGTGLSKDEWEANYADEHEDDDNGWGASIAEDQAMDERDEF